MKFKGKLTADRAEVQKILCSEDIIYFDFTVGNTEATVVYVDSITDKEVLGDQAIRPLSSFSKELTLEALTKSVKIASTKQGEEIKDLVADVLNGNPAFLVDGVKGYFSCDLKKFEVRAVAEPPLQTVIKGPREGFNESIKTNLSLLRRRIKTEHLIVKNTEVGRLSKTAVSVVYVRTIAEESLAEQIMEKLRKIDIDSVPDSSYIAKLLCTHKASIFKQINTAEKPDIVAARLMEGRIAIVVDGSPIVLTLPYLLIEDFQSPEDYYASTVRSNVTRWVRIAAVTFSVLLPALYVASQLFHLQFIPLNFLLTIVNSIKGIPMSPSFEMFFILLIFEILNEASIRMPKYAGMALSVVGALVLGDTAVRAGIVSSPAILIMSLSAISLYTVPELVETLSVIRLTLLIVAGAVGIYGVILVVMLLVIYLSTLENFSTPILAPFSPLVPGDLKDSFYLGYLSEMEYRPQSLKQKNKRRFRPAGKQKALKTRDKGGFRSDYED